MKYINQLFLTILCVVFSVTADLRAQEKAIYIYRNDGTFNGFLNNEIDSLVYSRIDVDSVEHDEYVVQEVWTADSIYRIPLAAIDSVSFNAPLPVIKSDVKFITEDYVPYIVKVDGLTISFKDDTPTSLLPTIGTVLVSDFYDEPFEYGFAGRVVNSSVNGKTLDFICEDVVLTDIYERLISVGNCESTNPQNSMSRARRINSSDQKYFDIGTFSTDIGPVTVENNPTVKMSWVIFIEPYIHPTVAITFTHTHNLSLSINSKIDGEHEPEPKWLDEASFLKQIKFLKGGYIPITTPIPGLYGKIRFGAFWSAHGDIDLSATFSGSLTFVNGFKWDETGFVPVNRISKKEMNRPEISLNMNGSIEGGIAMQIVSGVGTDKLASMNLTLRLGPQVAVNFKASDDGIQYGGWNWYSSLKDSQLNINAYAKFSAGYKTFLDQFMGKNEYENHSVPLVTWTKPIKKWYFLPEFTKPEYTDGRQENVIISTIPSRDLAKSVSLGFALFDNENQLVEKKYNEVNYRLESEWPFNNMQLTFENLKKGVDYTCYPIVKIFGKELVALPETQINVGTPVQITNVEVTNSTYYPEHFTYNGRSYSYKYDCAVTVKLKNKDNVEEWGYVYEDPDGQLAKIELTQFGDSYTDTRYAYYRNEDKAKVRLYGYVKYKDDNQYYFDNPTDYDLIYVEKPMCPDGNHPHMIDLGLPDGTMWSCCNIGASSPSEYGGLYCFGEPTGAMGTTNSWGWQPWPETISGTSYDIARAQWGDGWHLPTTSEAGQIYYSYYGCEWIWTSYEGTPGYKVVGPNGNSIFLPAGGNRWASSNGDVVHGKNEDCSYWLGNVIIEEGEERNSYYGMLLNKSKPDASEDAWTYFQGIFGWAGTGIGLCVRPVKSNNDSNESNARKNMKSANNVPNEIISTTEKPIANEWKERSSEIFIRKHK